MKGIKITLPIAIGEKCWTINCWVGVNYKSHYEIHENIVCMYEIYEQMINNKKEIQIVPKGRYNYLGVQPYLFATREEAEAKLKELKGE